MVRHRSDVRAERQHRLHASRARVVDDRRRELRPAEVRLGPDQDQQIPLGAGSGTGIEGDFGILERPAAPIRRPRRERPSDGEVVAGERGRSSPTLAEPDRRASGAGQCSRRCRHLPTRRSRRGARRRRPPAARPVRAASTESTVVEQPQPAAHERGRASGLPPPRSSQVRRRARNWAGWTGVGSRSSAPASNAAACI